jgi:GT2 family glycosyltransferase/Flp pilus assembly protein TadD
MGNASAAKARGEPPMSMAQTAAGYFQRALDSDPAFVMAGVNLVEALVDLDKKQQAIEVAGRMLDVLSRGSRLHSLVWESAHYPHGFDFFRVEWEKAAWAHAGLPAAEFQAKRDLLRSRLHLLLAELTGDLNHYYEAALTQPGLPPVRAALGCALGRASRFAEAVDHLRWAVTENPFDLEGARALFPALGSAGDPCGQRRLARDRRLLAQVAPQVVPQEPWFADAPLVGDELASIIILCCNQLDYTRRCVDSVLRHTRAPYELILIDNASNDATAGFLEEIPSRPGPARVVVIHNPRNLGFSAGCNQGRAQARGRYIVFLNNDTIVTESWLDGMISWALYDWPKVGLVGAVTNYASLPQQVSVDYHELDRLEAFGSRRRREFAGKALPVPRLSGFCLLTRREVLDHIGGFDDRYGLGFFEDDDLCIRAREAGYQLLVALNVFIHHFGSRTFAGLGLDCQVLLRNNFDQFRAKWGPERSAGYHLPEARIEPQVASGTMKEAVPEPPLETQIVSTALVGAAPEKEKTSVSLCMIVKNEEKNLHACLESAFDLVDEIVVVDTGSTDKTREAAAHFGARVVDFPWVDSFAAARNESLRHATGDWVFWLDADDRLDQDNRERLGALLAGLKDENVAYSMKCLCLSESKTTTPTVVDHVRLFRNHPEIRWQYRVHEQILPAIRRLGGAVRPATVVIHHLGYQDFSLRSQKHRRDLRLLQLDYAETPDDPFTLFNLGWLLSELRQPAEALPLLRRSLELSRPADSIVRKLFSLTVHCHRLLGQQAEALTACRTGRDYYPQDAELLSLESQIRKDQGDLVGAEQCLRRLLENHEGAHFASVDAGLGGYRTRHHLAGLYQEQGRSAEAAAQWRAALSEEPKYFPACLGLAQSYLGQGRWAELTQVLNHMEALQPDSPMIPLLQARAHLAQKELLAARQVLDKATGRFPQQVSLWSELGQVLVQEGNDLESAERILRTVLKLDPSNAEARNSLATLSNRPERTAQEPSRSPLTLQDIYQAACNTSSDINEHCPTLRALAWDCRHVTEMGTRAGVSTTAFLIAQPDKLVCYDFGKYPQIDRLRALSGPTKFVFHQADVLKVEIEETDLLFIDTLHNYDQLSEELRLHADHVRRYIVLHDTTTFGERGETEGHRGLWPAVEEFLAKGAFRLKRRDENNNGLTVLERIEAPE